MAKEPRQRINKRRRELREWVSSLKNIPCTDCKKEYPAVVMQFDHLGDEKKVDTVSKLVSGQYSRETILREIRKCEIVCANCHLIRTHILRKTMLKLPKKIQRTEAGVDSKKEIRKCKHGHSLSTGFSPTYSSWVAMISRCKYKTHPSYSHYGQLGIKVCDEWLNFVNFLEDMGERPINKSLDRIDITKGYFKENCQWSTRKQQDLNRTVTVFVEFNGVKIPLKQLADEFGINYGTLRNRIFRSGWEVEDAVTKKIQRKYG